MLKETLLVIDTETGGLNPKEHSLLTLAIMVIKEKQVVAHKEWQIKHATYHVTPKAMEVNGIDLLEHDNVAIEGRLVAQEILEFVGEHCSKEDRGMLVGQNTIFDKNYLEAFLGSFKEETFMSTYHKLVSHRYIDLMSITAFLNLAGVLDTNGLGLDAVIEALNLDVHARHTATDDARLTWEALLQLTERMTPTK